MFDTQLTHNKPVIQMKLQYLNHHHSTYRKLLKAGQTMQSNLFVPTGKKSLCHLKTLHSTVRAVELVDWMQCCNYSMCFKLSTVALLMAFANSKKHTEGDSNGAPKISDGPCCYLKQSNHYNHLLSYIPILKWGLMCPSSQHRWYYQQKINNASLVTTVSETVVSPSIKNNIIDYSMRSAFGNNCI